MSLQSPHSSPLHPLPQPGRGRAVWRPVPGSPTFCSWHLYHWAEVVCGWGLMARSQEEENLQRSRQSGVLPFATSSITLVPENLKVKKSLELGLGWVERKIFPTPPLAPTLYFHRAQTGPPEREGCPVLMVGWELCPIPGSPFPALHSAPLACDP